MTPSRSAEAVSQKTAKLAQRAIVWLLVCPDWIFPCFSSVVGRMPGHKGTVNCPPPHHGGLQPKWFPEVAQDFMQNGPSTSGFNSEKTIEPKSLDEGSDFWWGNPHYQECPSLKIQELLLWRKPVSISKAPAYFNVPFTISSNAFSAHGKLKLTREEVLHLRLTAFLISLFGLFGGMVPHQSHARGGNRGRPGGPVYICAG
jgi:hypothetical protein